METVLSEHFVFLNDKDMDLPIQVVYGENSPFIVSECQRAEGYSFKLKPGEKVFSDDLDMLRRALNFCERSRQKEGVEYVPLDCWRTCIHSGALEIRFIRSGMTRPKIKRKYFEHDFLNELGLG